ncbi:hypothetical protein F7725_023638, partial [Dissostichus mawsoni]
PRATEHEEGRKCARGVEGGCVVSSSRSTALFQSASCSLTMAVNIPGVAVMMFFYLLVLGIGIWASFKSKREAKKGTGDKTEMALLGNRGINLVVGIFTMTGDYVGRRRLHRGHS